LATFAACGGGQSSQRDAPGDDGGVAAADGGARWDSGDASFRDSPDDGAVLGADGAEAEGGAGPDPRTHLDVAWPGAGCGRPLPDDQPRAAAPGSPLGYKPYTVMGTGANLTATSLPAKAGPRTFWVRVPADYDPSHPYRVVYLGQSCGATGMANTYAYQLDRTVDGGNEEAIYVALDTPADQANMDCYDNFDGAASQEWEAFQLFEQVVDANYCTDLNRIYVAGETSGGTLANQWGCYFAGWPTPPRKFAPTYHIRGQAVVEGEEPDNQPACGGAVAAIWIHDTGDSGHPISGDLAALARVGRMNGCDTSDDDPGAQTTWHPELIVPGGTGGGCRRITGCPPDSPVVFCTTVGQGPFVVIDRPFITQAFTLFFDEVEARRAPGSGP
jgi:poly(3-hydroxybutyrate) depolymerase